jgi:hypothetical protein
VAAEVEAAKNLAGRSVVNEHLILCGQKDRHGGMICPVKNEKNNSTTADYGSARRSAFFRPSIKNTF